jgi:hypothetical protein
MKAAGIEHLISGVRMGVKIAWIYDINLWFREETERNIRVNTTI